MRNFTPMQLIVKRAGASGILLIKQMNAQETPTGQVVGFLRILCGVKRNVKTV
jgi:hypothetical protein